MLTHEEAQRLRTAAPEELGRRALEERNEFLFGVRDLRAESLKDHRLRSVPGRQSPPGDPLAARLGPEPGPAWGGELRVMLNQNVVVHFVPRFNEEMRSIDELPQFVVFPDDDREGEDQAHRYEAVKDLDAFEGVIFYVGVAQYRRVVEELATAAARYGDFPRLPDTLFGDADFVRLLTQRVLEHSLVRAERTYDFTKRAF